MIPHRKFAPNGDVHRQKHCKHHSADDQRRAAPGLGYPTCYGTATNEVVIASKRRAHFMPSVNWSVCSAAV